MTFARCSRQCWSLAARVLGWRPEEFWRSTPAELLASLQDAESCADPFASELLDELRHRFPD